MKRLLSAVLLFCFTLNAFASSSGVLKLERLLDDYQYAVTVEWDQKDQKYYDAETKRIFEGMSALIQEEGLTKGEVLTLVEQKLVNKRTLEALKFKLNVLSKTESPEDLARTLKESSKDMYSQGANWNAEVTIIAGIGIVIIAVLAYKWWWDVNHKCVAWEEKYDCTRSSWDDRHCSTEKDSNGVERETCDYYWQKEITETCGMMNFCTEYQKI